MRSGSSSWDYVIVGGGSAGCVLANRLSEDRATRVLLIEAGGRDLTPLIRFPAGFVRLKSRYNWSYLPEPDPSMNDAVEQWPAGMVIGGSSSTNATTWTRGHRGDFDLWASEGCYGWDYTNVLPYFRRSETFAGGMDAYRGGSGPQHVSFSAIKHPLIEAFIHSAEQSGIPYNPDLNGAVQEGVGHQQVSQLRGLRDSTATSYLARARHRSNLTVRLNALATRVVVDGNRAIGVVYRTRDESTTVYAEREVIVSAGSIASPKILMLSGIGPADHLRALQVPVVADLAGVGRNLQEHPVASFTYGVNCSTLNLELNIKGFVKHGLEFLLHGGGGVTAAGSVAVSFAKLSADHQRPDIEINFRPLAVERVPTHLRPGTKSADGLSGISPMTVAAVQSSAWLCHPRSRGTVTLRSADPTEQPMIRHTLLGNPDDVAELIAGCRLLRRIFQQDAFRPYNTGELSPGPDVNTDQEFDTFLRRTAHHGHHPVGTCKMGVDEESVVDPELRVRGVAGLRVVDASIMPSLITGHTNAATIMIAERASDLIRGSRMTAVRS